MHYHQTGSPCHLLYGQSCEAQVDAVHYRQGCRPVAVIPNADMLLCSGARRTRTNLASEEYAQAYIFTSSHVRSDGTARKRCHHPAQLSSLHLLLGVSYVQVARSTRHVIIICTRLQPLHAVQSSGRNSAQVILSAPLHLQPGKAPRCVVPSSGCVGIPIKVSSEAETLRVANHRSAGPLQVRAACITFTLGPQRSSCGVLTS
jgi:hypothetical protein